MKGKYQIPFDIKGNQLHYPGFSLDHWEDNVEFPGPIEITGYARGCSAAYFEGQLKNGCSVVIFLTDFEEMLPHLVNGSVDGLFTFIKRGQNYGVKMISPAEPQAGIIRFTYDGTPQTLPREGEPIIVIGINEVLYYVEAYDDWCTFDRRTGYNPDYIRSAGQQWFYLPAEENSKA